MPDARIAERLHFLCALRAIPIAETVRVPRMAAELGNAVCDVLDQADERICSDRVVIRPSAAVVAVELAAELDTRVGAAQGDRQLRSDLLEGSAYELREMTMLVRVEMRRISTHKQPKALELTPQVLRRPSLHDGGGPRRSPFRYRGRPPAPDLDVQPKPEARSLPRSFAAPSAAGRSTMRLALVTMPSSWASRIPRLTLSLRPKSSALTIR